MKDYLYIIILTMLFGLFSCKDKNKDFVYDEFKSQIEKQGMKIDSVDEEGLIYISQGELLLKVSLDNVRKNFERDKDTFHISNLVNSLVTHSIEIPSNWSDAKNDIYISFFRNDYEFEDAIHHKLTDVFSKVYIHSGQNNLTWITKDNLKKWNITESDLDEQANLNADNLLNKTEITFDTIESHKLGLINAEEGHLKGALLFAPSMKEKIKNDFGYPFYAVLPVRDFCYIFSEKDFDFFSNRIGKVVVEEFENSGYPISTELLKFTDKGVEAVGEYPVNK